MNPLYAVLMMGIVAGGFAAPAAAQSNWPTKPVRLVNTFAAGGTADVLARLVADQLSQLSTIRGDAKKQPGDSQVRNLEPARCRYLDCADQLVSERSAHDLELQSLDA
jgi:hypothetical protein